MSAATMTLLNGVNVDQLVGTISAIQDDPTIARFQFRSETEWVDGGHCQTRIQTFHGANQEDTSRRKPFVLDGDEPPILLGSNKGANAVEAVLHALGACLSVGFIYNAAAQGIRVESLNLQLEGDLDLHAFLGLSDTMRPGYENIRVHCRAKSDASRDQLQALWEYVQKTSPVLDILRKPVPVSLVLE